MLSEANFSQNGALEVPIGPKNGAKGLQIRKKFAPSRRQVFRRGASLFRAAAKKITRGAKKEGRELGGLRFAFLLLGVACRLQSEVADSGSVLATLGVRTFRFLAPFLFCEPNVCETGRPEAMFPDERTARVGKAPAGMPPEGGPA